MMSASMPVCSVCVANYNGVELLDACIGSILRQDCGAEVEIIVHDDASTDASLALLAERYPQVQVIASERNVGFCIANNRMAAAARGEFLLLLNNDAELLPDALRTLLDAARSIGTPAILSLPQFDLATGRLIDIGSLLDPFLNTVPNLDPSLGDVAAVIGACLWVPRTLWQELGGFPDWFGSLAEDTFLCCAARLHGCRVIALGSSGFRHRVGASLGGGKPAADNRLRTSLRRRALSERNKNQVMVMTYPAALLVALLPLHILLLLAEGAVLSVLRADARLWREVYVASIAALWQERRRLSGMRARLQAHRRIGCFDFVRPLTWLPHKLRLLSRHGLPRVD